MIMMMFMFFFIIVTHMRQDEVKVRYRVPEGRQLTKMKKKSGVTHVYIGKPVDGRQEGYRIQVDSKVVAIDQLVDYLAESRSGMSPDEAYGRQGLEVPEGALCRQGCRHEDSDGGEAGAATGKRPEGDVHRNQDKQRLVRRKK